MLKLCSVNNNYVKKVLGGFIGTFRYRSLTSITNNNNDDNEENEEKIFSELNKRFPNTSKLPDLSKLDPIMDLNGTIIDPPLSTLTTRPSSIITAPETESDDTDVLSAITGLSSVEIRDLQKKALVIKRVKNQTAKGRVVSMYVLVVVGNGNGVAGFGEGKHEESPTAIKKATNQAIKNLRYFERYDDRTIFHDIEHKFHGTTIKFFARPPDISSKIFGSRNGMNVIKCTFDAFNSQRLPQQIARARGKNLFDVYHTYYGAR
ncbi:ribosomal protein S5 domain 2-like protein [Gigaspora margarita]|uniref:Small ribosomal subunit protein uS5m n=1 Tax=Gigaspora margarita TaxID=4874 RepID=A0A8H4AWW5_GIGMA|nr:ribosomal protein S5 domain 2-like protein [Gigaspora margarita]